ncbi:MAG: N-acetylmuramoyl-L-alanine amidase [Clostridia bacterium]|nr:N-acetylmuramoyl-L-alanine amidase [Clostridia bacterium]
MAIKIFIDQGHNPEGVNAGAEGFGYREQDINYAVGTRLGELLRDDGRFEVKLSRNSPTDSLGTSNATSLASRVNAANNWPADYFISIHANASTNPAQNGTEVYVYRDPSTAADLAKEVLTGIVERMDTRDNGVRVNSALYVLRRTTMPAILVELGYITNAEDVKKMTEDPWGFAQGIYNGILRYFDYAPNT